LSVWIPGVGGRDDVGEREGALYGIRSSNESVMPMAPPVTACA
jgi:hypothetical protein